MGVPRQLTQVAFAAPLDESTEDEILDPTVGFPVLENVRQDKRGGLSKRLGYGALSSSRFDTDDRATGRRLFDHRDAACVVDSSGIVDCYNETLSTSVVRAGRLPECTVTTTQHAGSGLLPNPTQQLPAFDAVVCNGFLVTLQLFGDDDVIASVTDAATGAAVRVPEYLFAPGSIAGLTGTPTFQVGSFGTTVIAVVSGFSSANIYQAILDCTDLTTLADGWTFDTNIIASDRKTSSTYLSLQSLSDKVAFAYVNNGSGTSQVTVTTLKGVINTIDATTTLNTSSVTPDVLAIEGTSTLWVSWNEAEDLMVAGLNPSTLAVTATKAYVLGLSGSTYAATDPPQIVSGPGASDGAVVINVYGNGATYGTLHANNWTVTAGAIDPDAVAGYRQAGARPIARPFTRGGRFYGLFTPSGVSGRAIMCDWTDFAMGADQTLGEKRVRPVGHAFPGLYVEEVSASAHAAQLETDVWGYMHACTSSASAAAASLVAYNFADPENWRTAYHNGSTILSGGVTSVLGPSRVTELSILHAPAPPEPTDTGAGGGPTGAVSYVAVYEEVDDAGNLVWSGASLPAACTGTTNAVTVVVQPLAITQRDRVNISLYRTQASDALYYLVDTLPNDDSPVQFTDELDDATLGTARRLFGSGLLPGTGGGALQREAPPYARDVVSYNGMAVIASGPDLWWSGQTVGGEGAWFSSEEFFVPVDGPGDIIALAVQDGTLYVFKERAIYTVVGETPSDNGASGGLGTPRRLAGDVGCIRASSVAVTALGIFFQSHRGIELLSGGRATWIGEKVQRTLAAYPTVTSAVVDAYNNLVRFSLANGFDSEGSVTAWDSEDGGDLGGKDLVFDLTMGDWQSVDIKSVSGQSYVASQDACVINGRYAWLSSDGTLYTEKSASDSDAYRDPGGDWIAMAVETGWWKLAGIQGRQQFNRMLALFRKHTPCDLRISIGYEYRDDFATEVERTYDDLATLETLDVPIQFRVDPNDDAEGMAIRVRIEDELFDLGEDTPSVGTGRGCTWLALTFDITPKDGPAEVPEEAA